MPFLPTDSVPFRCAKCGCVQAVAVGDDAEKIDAVRCWKCGCVELVNEDKLTKEPPYTVEGKPAAI